MKAVAAALALSLGAAPAANAADIIVNAATNSSTGGVGVLALSGLTLGQGFTVSVDADDLWNAGPLPRWSNADGLTGPLFATGTDESGEAAGTQIGGNFGTHTQNGLTTAFGTLVGEIGGVYQVIGTSFNGTAWAAGNLSLFYWDSDNFNNTQFVTASVSAVPEAGTWAMMILGLGVAGGALRRRRAEQAAITA